MKPTTGFIIAVVVTGCVFGAKSLFPLAIRRDLEMVRVLFMNLIVQRKEHIKHVEKYREDLKAWEARVQEYKAEKLRQHTPRAVAVQGDANN